MVTDIKVNKGEWDGVSVEDRKKIEQLISQHFRGAKIVPDASAETSTESLGKSRVRSFNVRNAICSAACGAAEAAAVAGCSALADPIAIALCVSAAHAAGDYCRSQC